MTLDTALYNISDIGNDDKNCLAANLYLDHGGEWVNGSQYFSQTAKSEGEFAPVECNKRSDLSMILGAPVEQSLMICEVRAQTVTYLAWFYSNWLAFLLILMTFLLLTTLCLSVFKYKGGRSVYSNRRVYRAEACTTAQPVQPTRDDLPYGDDPPTYSDVTGIVTETQQTKMDKYKNKGKEILAKVTLYKNTTN